MTTYTFMKTQGTSAVELDENGQTTGHYIRLAFTTGLNKTYMQVMALILVHIGQFMPVTGILIKYKKVCL